jgi:hypothetical protein
MFGYDKKFNAKIVFFFKEPKFDWRKSKVELLFQVLDNLFQVSNFKQCLVELPITIYKWPRLLIVEDNNTTSRESVFAQKKENLIHFLHSLLPYVVLEMKNSYILILQV